MLNDYQPPSPNLDFGNQDDVSECSSAANFKATKNRDTDVSQNALNDFSSLLK